LSVSLFSDDWREMIWWEQEDRPLELAKLPIEILGEILLFLGPKDLGRLACCSRTFYNIACQEYLWKRLFCFLSGSASFLSSSHFKVLSIDPNFFSWKDLYKQSTEWKWDSLSKSEVLKVSHCELVVSRTEPTGINPCIRTTKCFSKIRNYIEIELLQIGDWFQLGIADDSVHMNDGDILCHQGTNQNRFSVAYGKWGSLAFPSTRSSLVTRYQAATTTITTEKQRMEGDVLGIQWLEKTSEFLFFWNSKLYETLKIKENYLKHSSNGSQTTNILTEEGNSISIEDLKLYPTAQISFGTQLRIRTTSAHRKLREMENF